MQCAVCSVQCAVYIVQCILCILQFAVYNTKCAMAVFSALCNGEGLVCSAQGADSCIRCMVYITVYIVHKYGKRGYIRLLW